MDRINKSNALEESQEDIMVSVCCLVYNHEKYLRQCLDGFVMQKTAFKYEVLIHDDASTDNSVDIIREYEAKYPDIIKPIYQTENQHSKGVRISWKFQYPRARGKYIAMCEGDDYWSDENKLQMQFDIMELNPEVSLCTHRIDWIKESGEPIDRHYPEIQDFPSFMTGEEFTKLLLSDQYYQFQTSCYFFPLKFIVQIMDGRVDFLNKKTGVGDYPLQLYLSTQGNLFYIDKSMSCYRRLSIGSWSNKFDADIKKRTLHFAGLIEMYQAFDKYTQGKYTYLIERIIKKKEFQIFQFKKEYNRMLKKEYKEFFNELTTKEKLFVFFSARTPKLMGIYSRIKYAN